MLSYLSVVHAIKPLIFNLDSKNSSLKEIAYKEFHTYLTQNTNNYKIKYNPEDLESLDESNGYYDVPKNSIVILFEGLTIVYNRYQRCKSPNNYYLQFIVSSDKTDDVGYITVKITSTKISIQPRGDLDLDEFYSFINYIERLVIKIGKKNGALDEMQFRRIKQDYN
ncbi:hypothetical protein NEOKW01_1384 [Nematocida sp. AWRm80]|nr:hypothetical protein NEOKW01_1384 [Nematocida sp. AWRm80]